MTTDKQNPKTSETPPSSSSSTKLSSEVGRSSKGHSGQKPHYPNRPEVTNPDAATLREQWRYAVRQYSKWYSHAWGTAILAGLSFFALGWIVKGSNPLPSFQKDSHTDPDDSDNSK